MDEQPALLVPNREEHIITRAMLRNRNAEDVIVLRSDRPFMMGWLAAILG